MNKFTDFVKKNSVLVIILAVGLIITIVLGYCWYNAYDAVAKADAEIRKYVKESDLIHAKKNPVAVKASEVVILKNIRSLNDKIKESQRHFGFPYRKAFKQNFIQTLNEPFSIASENEKNSDALKAGLKKISYTEDDVLQIFKKIYDTYYESNNKHADTSDLDNLMKDRENIYNAFRLAIIAPDEKDNLTDDEKIRYIAKAGEVYDKAVREFLKKIQPETLEQVDENDVKHILMDAMGLPRMMSNLACKGYIEEIRNNILHNAKIPEYLEAAKREKNAVRVAELQKLLEEPELIPGMRQYVEENKVDVSAQSSFGNRISQDHKTPEQMIDALVYENPANQLPPSGNIVHILNHYKIVEDVYNRIRNSGIRKVYKFDRETPLNGAALEISSLKVGKGKRIPGGGNMRYYEYTVVVESSLADIQKFVNSLHDAYNDNRIYAIRSVSIENNGKSINSATEKLKAAEAEIKGAAKTQDAANEAAAGASDTGESEKMRLNRIFSNNLYGNVLIGQGAVTAKISFRYLVYTGDQLENMR